jgi:hypothetical protein
MEQTSAMQSYVSTQSMITAPSFHETGSSVEFIHDFDVPSAENRVDSIISPKSLVSPPPEHLAVINIGGVCPAKLHTIPSNSKYSASTSLPRLHRVTPFSKQASMNNERIQTVKHSESTALTERSMENIQGDGSLDGVDYETHLTKGSQGMFSDHYEGDVGVVLNFSWNEPDVFPIDSCFYGIASPEPVLAAISNKFTTADGSPPENVASTSKTVAKTANPCRSCCPQHSTERRNSAKKV